MPADIAEVAAVSDSATLTVAAYALPKLAAMSYGLGAAKAVESKSSLLRKSYLYIFSPRHTMTNLSPIMYIIATGSRNEKHLVYLIYSYHQCYINLQLLC